MALFPMRRVLRFLGLAAVLQAGTVHAQLDGRLGFLARQLEKASDPRVRAQNALLLAAAKEPAVVRPLCGALADKSDLVRASVAKALAQLGEVSAIDCLRAKQDDPDGAVKAEIARAIAALEAARDKKPELYISMAPVADRSSKLPPEVVKLTEERVRARLQAMGGVFAPSNESRAAARKVIKSRKLKGFMLKVELDSTPAGGLKVNLVCFTYPEKSLLGEVNVKASGGQAADLVRALAPKVVEEAAETFNWSS
jgi:hypothetical protein